MSPLFVPAINARSLEKAATLEADALILDLEDAVLPERKFEARDRVLSALEGEFCAQTVTVRVNSLRTPWGEADVKATLETGCQALVIPKVESLEDLPKHGNKPLWAMLETPLGILNAQVIAADPRVEVLLLGTSDLIANLHARHTPGRENLFYAMGRVVLCARAYGKVALDGVFLEYRDLRGFEQACSQARDFGLSGKTLIHPSQIEAARRVFRPSSRELEHAQKLLEVWENARERGEAVATLEGYLIEELHVRQARRLLEGQAKQG